MASKNKTVYICSECGARYPKWNGKCTACGEWDTLVETNEVPSTNTVKTVSLPTAVRLNEISENTEHRFDTGIGELNRVLGGGLVKGSLVLISGDPGIGKSTLLLQTTQTLGKDKRVLYVSGEESPHQLKLRAKRLSVDSDNLYILCNTDAESVCDYINNDKPDVVIIDSIQTMVISDINSLPGSIVQVRECASLFMRLSKTLNIPVILVGHVNKDGNIAGPKVLEHIVDCVLYFEGEKNISYRILRAVKNRFGSTNEIGVFEMKNNGLSEVPNPSKALLAGKPLNVSGSCIACAVEGTRPILAEVQGLVSATGFGTARRMSTGFDYNRMSMILAVLEKRVGYFMGNADVYVNVAGGLKIDEPASDLPVAISLISGFKDEPVRDDCIVFGEIGLAGEIRAVNFCEMRINEAIRMGYKKCIIPYYNFKELSSELKTKTEIVGVSSIRRAYEEATVK